MGNFSAYHFPIFDKLEIFRSEDENDYFPFHFHDYYCISLITKGTELLENTNQKFYIPCGSISVTQANEVHRNGSLGGGGYSYQTVYLNPDLLKFCSKGKDINALQRVINDTSLATRLSVLFNTKNGHENSWLNFFSTLSLYKDDQLSNARFTKWQDLMDEIIEDHPNNPIKSAWLSRQFCMSEFHFIRTFKQSAGITPQTYIMLSKLAKSKKMLLEGNPLTDVAMSLGFTDSSHFSRCFKKYFGFAPGRLLRSQT